MNDSSPSLSSTSNTQVSHDEISRHAQELWDRYGRPSGRDEEIWLEAERNLTAQRSTPTPPPAAAEAAPPAPAARAPETGRAATGGRTSRAGGASATARMPGSRSRTKG